MGKVGRVRSTVNPQSGRKRRYDSSSRAENAAATRHSILESARELFVLQGYGRTTVAQIAAHASVAVDTIYATVGRKPALMRELVETSISGRDHAVPARQREYVQRIEAAETASGQDLALRGGRHSDPTATRTDLPRPPGRRFDR